IRIGFDGIILCLEVYRASHCQFIRNGSRPFVCRLDSPFTKASRQTRKLDNCNWNLTYNITINLCDFHRAISYRDAVECEYNPWYYCEYSMWFRSCSMYNIFKTVESCRLDKFDDFIKAILRYYIIFFLFYI